MFVEFFVGDDSFFFLDDLRNLIIEPKQSSEEIRYYSRESSRRSSFEKSSTGEASILMGYAGADFDKATLVAPGEVFVATYCLAFFIGHVIGS